MSKKKKKYCCEKKMDECCNYNQGCAVGTGGAGCTPIIFLLIAWAAGLLNCNKSYLIILLCLLCGGNFASLLGGNCNNSCC